MTAPCPALYLVPGGNVSFPQHCSFPQPHPYCFFREIEREKKTGAKRLGASVNGLKLFHVLASSVWKLCCAFLLNYSHNFMVKMPFSLIVCKFWPYSWQWRAQYKKRLSSSCISLVWLVVPPKNTKWEPSTFCLHKSFCEEANFPSHNSSVSVALGGRSWKLSSHLMGNGRLPSWHFPAGQLSMVPILVSGWIERASDLLVVCKVTMW